MSNNKQKYVYIQKGSTSIWNKLIIGNIYEIEYDTWTYTIYPHYMMKKYNIMFDISDMYHFISLEEWRNQQINKILENG